MKSISSIYPDTQYPHVTELDILMAELIYPILVEIAPLGKTLTYKGVVEEVKKRYSNIPEVKTLHHRHIGRRLGTIWRFTEKHGCPHIGSLVINKDTGECGRGITQFLDPEKEREKVKNFNWSSVDVVFSEHIKKSRAAKKAKEVKLKKRNYDDAKSIFIDFWKSIENESPIPSKEISQYRKELISEVEKGYSPETVFSQKLLELLNSGKLKNDPVIGYVYIGEYQNIETGQPLFDNVKIGFTNSDIEQRATALSGGVIGPLIFVMKHVWCFKPGYAYIAEQELHGIFHEYREMGEFFSSMDGLIEEWASEAISEKYEDIAELILVNGVSVVNE